jgi:hypothetical protein
MSERIIVFLAPYLQGEINAAHCRYTVEIFG